MWFNKVVTSDMSIDLCCYHYFNGFSNKLNIKYWSIVFHDMRSWLAFLSSGLTKATISLSGKIPDVNDLFMISVSIVITDGRISFSSMVGIGSKSQLLLEEMLIIFSTSSCNSG